MDHLLRLAENLDHWRETGALAWPATLTLVGVALITRWGVSYATRHEVPAIVRSILEGLSNRDLSSKK